MRSRRLCLALASALAVMAAGTLAHADATDAPKGKAVTVFGTTFCFGATPPGATCHVVLPARETKNVAGISAVMATLKAKLEGKGKHHPGGDARTATTPPAPSTP